jgi:hypothetical protein
MANLIASLPAMERARLYREMAAETRRHAEGAMPDMKSTFLMLSGCWDRLAEDLGEEHVAGGECAVGLASCVNDD